MQANTDEVPKRVLADAGYRSEDNSLCFEQAEVTGYVALGNEKKDSGRQPNPVDPDD